MSSIHPNLNHNHNHKRRRHDDDDEEEEDNDGATILHGVVACLSGFPAQEKDVLHAQIQRLGGTWTRDFSTEQNTHLIAIAAQGAKFEAAAATAAATAAVASRTVSVAAMLVHIVKPQWIVACARAQRRVPEDAYAWIKPSPSTAAAAATITIPYSLEDALQTFDSEVVDRNWSLFSSCHFYLMGAGNDCMTKLSVVSNSDDKSALQQLQRLIRRGMGTIHWHVVVMVTHVVVVAPATQAVDPHQCKARFAAATLTSNASNSRLPVFVSPQWILDSYREGKLLPTSAQKYEPPQFSIVPVKKEMVVSKATSSSKQNQQPTLFRGCVFVLARRTVLPPGAVDWDSSTLTELIVAHGGVMLTTELLMALQKDQLPMSSRNGKTHKPKRTCFVLRWGGSNSSTVDIVDEDDEDSLDPLLQRAKQLCQVQNVTPIWLQTCASEERYLEPHHLPELFLPSTRPILSFTAATGIRSNATKTKTTATATVVVPPAPRVSVTGFSGSLRTAMQHLLQAMGAHYDDALRKTTTHLVVQMPPQGPKYETARQWKSLHCVTEDWVYHVMRHGWNRNGGVGSDNHCSDNAAAGGGGEQRDEDRFAVVPPLQ